MTDPTDRPTGGLRAGATVRMFAALRDAAGTGEVAVAAPVHLSRLLADLSSQHGSRFADRLQVAAVMVDGSPVDRDADLVVQPGSEVALLPPFAGGAADHIPHHLGLPPLPTGHPAR